MDKTSHKKGMKNCIRYNCFQPEDMKDKRS